MTSGGFSGIIGGVVQSRERFRYDKNRWLKQKYGLTLADFERLSLNQKMRCVICQKVRPLVVDHDHSNGRVRALLCRDCNLVLGYMNDDDLRLKRAATYVRKWRISHSS